MAISPALALMAITQILALALRREPRPTDCDDCEYMAEQEHHTRLADGAYAEWYAAINRAADDAEQREWIAAGGVPFD